MRKLIFILSIVLILVCSCEMDSYHVGDVGPAGGLIFYDCDADNWCGNEDGLRSEVCGWRYLEIAPTDIKVSTTTDFIFGYYRQSAGGDPLFANGYFYDEGFSTAGDGKSTGVKIGTGKANTTKLVNAMKNSAYTAHVGGNTTTSSYAAKLCDDYTYGGYSDWFLPSINELKFMYANLKLEGLGGFSNAVYWSSSEGTSSGYVAQCVDFSNGSTWSSARMYAQKVRPIRAFLD